jgi:hypothetical protein
MTLKELKILLALNGNQQIPYAEEEIFNSKELSLIYLLAISEDLLWHKDYTYEDIPHLAYNYAIDIIKGRWPEAEKLIQEDMPSRFRYNIYMRHIGEDFKLPA